MKRTLAVVLALPFAAIACSSPDAPGSANAAQCKSLQDVVHEDSSGKTLSRAQEIHEPTSEEIQAAAFFYAVAIDAYRRGSLDEDLAKMISTASKDPAQEALFGGTVDDTYAELAPACSVDKISSPLISAPYACTDDCRITVADLAKHFGLYDAIMSALVKTAGGDAADLVNNIKAAMQGESATSLSDAVKANIPQDQALNLVREAGSTFAGNLAVGGSAAAAVGQEHVAAAVDAIAGFIYLPLVAAKIKELAALIEGCRAYLASPACGKVTGISNVTLHVRSDSGEVMTVSMDATVNLSVTPTKGQLGAGTLNGKAKLVASASVKADCFTTSTPTKQFEVEVTGTYRRKPDGSVAVQFMPAGAPPALDWTSTLTCGNESMTFPFAKGAQMSPCIGTLKGGTFTPVAIPNGGNFADMKVDYECDLKASDKTFQ
ncbi:MAG: hypothetical protein U0270_15180 [Labilithrix sp.]